MTRCIVLLLALSMGVFSTSDILGAPDLFEELFDEKCDFKFDGVYRLLEDKMVDAFDSTDCIKYMVGAASAYESDKKDFCAGDDVFKRCGDQIAQAVLASLPENCFKNENTQKQCHEFSDAIVNTVLGDNDPIMMGELGFLLFCSGPNESDLLSYSLKHSYEAWCLDQTQVIHVDFTVDAPTTSALTVDKDTLDKQTKELGFASKDDNVTDGYDVRKNASAQPPETQKKKQSAWLTFFVVVLALAVIGAGAYFGWKQYRARRTQASWDMFMLNNENNNAIGKYTPLDGGVEL